MSDGYQLLVDAVKDNGESARRIEVLFEGHATRLEGLKDQIEKHDQRTAETKEAVMETNGEIKALARSHETLTKTVERIGSKVDSTSERVAKVEKHNAIQDKAEVPITPILGTILIAMAIVLMATHPELAPVLAGIFK